MFVTLGDDVSVTVSEDIYDICQMVRLIDYDVCVSGGDVVVSKEITKQVKLAQQCVDRVAVLIDKIGEAYTEQ